MEDKGRLDLFKPEQPQIPGVQPVKGQASLNSTSWSLPLSRIALGMGGALLLGAVIAGLTLRPWSGEASPTEVDNTAAEARQVEQAQPSRASQPRGVASVTEMSRFWTVKEFSFQSPFSAPTPALLVRLPDGSGNTSGSYWAFIKRAPYGNCDLEFVTDLKRLQSEFRYAARHPMIVDSCTGSVYNPLAHASVGDVLVRGDVVKGSSLRPPLVIDVRVRNGQIFAERRE